MNEYDMIQLDFTAEQVDLILHALAVTGTKVSQRRGTDAAEQYDRLYDRIQECAEVQR